MKIGKLEQLDMRMSLAGGYRTSDRKFRIHYINNFISIRDYLQRIIIAVCIVVYTTVFISDKQVHILVFN